MWNFPVHKTTKKLSFNFQIFCHPQFNSHHTEYLINYWTVVGSFPLPPKLWELFTCISSYPLSFFDIQSGLLIPFCLCVRGYIQDSHLTISCFIQKIGLVNTKVGLFSDGKRTLTLIKGSQLSALYQAYLHYQGAAINVYFFAEEVRSNGGSEAATEAIVNILVHQGRLAHPVEKATLASDPESRPVTHPPINQQMTGWYQERTLFSKLCCMKIQECYDHSNCGPLS